MTARDEIVEALRNSIQNEIDEEILNELYIASLNYLPLAITF